MVGKTLNEWLILFNMSHNLKKDGFHQWCWPDGKSGLEQSQVLVNVFNIIKAEAMTQIDKKMKQKNK